MRLKGSGEVFLQSTDSILIESDLSTGEKEWLGPLTYFPCRGNAVQQLIDQHKQHLLLRTANDISVQFKLVRPCIFLIPNLNSQFVARVVGHLRDVTTACSFA